MSPASDRTAWWIVGLALLSLGGPLFLLQGYDLASQYEDDAFYYFQIAKNVAQGRGFTFDGIHDTNGFHLLWLFALVPIFGLLPGLDAAVRAAGLLEALLVALAAAGIYRGLRERIGREPALLAALLLFALPGTRSILRVGLESALTVFMLSRIWLGWIDLDRQRIGDWLRLGLWCGLAALSRLETLAAVPALLLLERDALKANRRACAALVLPPLLCFAAYASWSFVHFGLWLPVSGMVKSVWARREGYALAHGIVVPPTVPSMLAGAVAIAFVLIVLARWRPAWLLPFRESGLALPALIAAGIVVIDVVSVGGMARWYRGPIVLCAAIAAAAVLRKRHILVRLALIASAATAIARVPYTTWAVANHRLSAHWFGQAADWAKKHTQPETRIGSWNGGILAYYSGRHVVMLDGLANDAGFYRRVILRGDLHGYLEQEHIDLISWGGCSEGPPGWAVPDELRPSIERTWGLAAAITGRVADGGCRGVMVWGRR